MTSLLRDFEGMNPFIFRVQGEDPQELLNGVYKELSAIGVTSRENVDLPSYQLSECAQVWYSVWKYNRPVESE